MMAPAGNVCRPWMLSSRLTALQYKKITRTAIHYLVIDDPVKAGARNKNVRIKKLAKPLPVFVVERVPVRTKPTRA